MLAKLRGLIRRARGFFAKTYCGAIDGANDGFHHKFGAFHARPGADGTWHPPCNAESSARSAMIAVRVSRSSSLDNISSASRSLNGAIELQTATLADGG